MAAASSTRTRPRSCSTARTVSPRASSSRASSRTAYATIGLPIDGLRRALLTGRVGMIIDGAWILYAEQQAGRSRTWTSRRFPRPQAGQRSVNVVERRRLCRVQAVQAPGGSGEIRAVHGDARRRSNTGSQLLKTGVSPGVVERGLCEGDIREMAGARESAGDERGRRALSRARRAGRASSIRCSPRSRRSARAPIRNRR